MLVLDEGSLWGDMAEWNGDRTSSVLQWVSFDLG